jgi:hypothetical protein
LTKPIDEMTMEELIWAIEGYAASAKRSFDNGNDPWPTLSRIRSMIDRYENAPSRRSTKTRGGSSAAGPADPQP